MCWACAARLRLNTAYDVQYNLLFEQHKEALSDYVANKIQRALLVSIPGRVSYYEIILLCTLMLCKKVILHKEITRKHEL